MLKYLRIGIVCAWLVSQDIGFWCSTDPIEDALNLKIYLPKEPLSVYVATIKKLYELIPQFTRPDANDDELFTISHWSRR